MQIINKSKNTILAREGIVADTWFKRIKGLLGTKQLKKSQALILKPGNSIHTFFMQFAIDVLFIDKDNKVIKAISCLAPYRLSGIYFNARLVIELPAQTIQSTSTEQGDILFLE